MTAVAPQATAPEGTLILRPDEPLMFLNAGAVRDEVRDAIAAAEPRPSVLILDLSMSPDLDVECVDVLDRIAEQLANQGIELRLVDVRSPVQVMLDRAAENGSRRLPTYATMADALPDGS